MNMTLKNFSKASQKRDWAIVIWTSFISFLVNGNDFGAGTIFRKDGIHKCELEGASQIGCDIGSSYAKKVSRTLASET